MCAYREYWAAVDEVAEVDKVRKQKLRETKFKRVRGAGKTVSPTLSIAQSRRDSTILNNATMASAVKNTRSIDSSEKWDKRHLVLIFCVWKVLLLLLSAFTPGPGYDTSGFVLYDSSIDRYDHFASISRGDRLTINLLRWDAIYFVKAAERGHIFEQEWAFSWANSHLLRAVEQCETLCHPYDPALT